MIWRSFAGSLLTTSIKLILNWRRLLNFPRWDSCWSLFSKSHPSAPSPYLLSFVFPCVLIIKDNFRGFFPWLVLSEQSFRNIRSIEQVTNFRLAVISHPENTICNNSLLLLVPFTAQAQSCLFLSSCSNGSPTAVRLPEFSQRNRLKDQSSLPCIESHRAESDMTSSPKKFLTDTLRTPPEKELVTSGNR